MAVLVLGTKPAVSTVAYVQRDRHKRCPGLTAAPGWEAVAAGPGPIRTAWWPQPQLSPDPALRPCRYVRLCCAWWWRASFEDWRAFWVATPGHAENITATGREGEFVVF